MLTGTVFALVAAILGYHVATTVSVPGISNDSRAGLVDFRDQVYYPAVSLLEGNNPYDAASHTRNYPAVKVFAPYTPLILALSLPFGLLPLWLAQLTYFILNLGFILVLARLTLRICGWDATPAQVFGIGTLILVSRPGEWNALLGQFGALAAIATYLALYYGRTRPWLAGLGFALSTFKPTFGVPVAVLMLAQGDRRAVAIGGTIAVVISAAVAAMLAHSSGGFQPFLLALREGYFAWRVESGDPISSILRVDAVALLAQLLGRSPGIAAEIGISIGLLGLGAFLVRRLTTAPEQEAPRALAVSLGCLVILTAVYHLPYDLLLLLLPLTWLFTQLRRRTEIREAGIYLVLFGLLVLPMANYLTFGRPASLIGLTGAWRDAALMLNPSAVLLTLIIWTIVALGAVRGRT